MTKLDERLARAKAYLAVAESKDSKREAYKLAAKEIAAYKEETGESNRKIAAACKTHDRTIDRLLKWHASGFKADTPFLMDGKATERAAMSHTKAVLREAPLEQVERIIDELPRERKQAIGAAAGHAYMKARQAYDDKEATLTQAEKDEREKARRTVEQTTDRLANTFGAMSIVAHIEQATEDLSEAMRRGGLSSQEHEAIKTAIDRLVATFEFAREMAGA
jgi:hypothetical protein